MTSLRKVDNRSAKRHEVLKYLREHPQEFRYLVGDYLAQHPETIMRIVEQNMLKMKNKIKKKEAK